MSRKWSALVANALIFSFRRFNIISYKFIMVIYIVSDFLGILKSVFFFEKPFRIPLVNPKIQFHHVIDLNLPAKMTPNCMINVHKMFVSPTCSPAGQL